jgi:hypothetical protein
MNPSSDNLTFAESLYDRDISYNHEQVLLLITFEYIFSMPLNIFLLAESNCNTQHNIILTLRDQYGVIQDIVIISNRALKMSVNRKFIIFGHK